jgi:hypothetical protein
MGRWEPIKTMESKPGDKIRTVVKQNRYPVSGILN